MPTSIACSNTVAGYLDGVPRSRRARIPLGRRGAPEDGLKDLQDLVHLASSAGEEGVEVRRIQPARAAKSYICGGCQQEILPRTAHLVVVPRDAPDLRRHWHTPCWQLRDRRRPGR
jgi:hypothetical protein